jgi:hypothetical protein
MGEWRYSSTILHPDTRWRRVVASDPGHFAPRERSPLYLLDRGLGGPVFEIVEKRKILSLPEIEPRPSSPITIRTELLPTRFKTVYKDKYNHYKNHYVQGLGPFWHSLTPFLPRSSSGTASSRLFPRSLAERSSGILNIRSLQPVLQSSVLSWRLRTLKLSSAIQKCWAIAIKNLHLICFCSSYPVCC